MGLTEALEAYAKYQRLCPACKRAAKQAGSRIESNCRNGKHAKSKGVLLEGPPV